MKFLSSLLARFRGRKENAQPRMFRIDRRRLVSAGGMAIMDSTASMVTEVPCTPDECGMTEHSDRIAGYECGHDGPAWFRVTLYGMQSKRFEDGRKCPECRLAKMKLTVIRCAVCRGVIFPDDPVVLYDPDCGPIQKDIMTLADGFAIGCMDWDCCVTGGMFAGYWTRDGFRPA